MPYVLSQRSSTAVLTLLRKPTVSDQYNTPPRNNMPMLLKTMPDAHPGFQPNTAFGVMLVMPLDCG